MNKHWSPYEKYRQVRKEAKATGGLLVLLILFWCFAGFGLSGVDVEMFGLPLWAVMGSVMTTFSAKSTPVFSVEVGPAFSV